MTDATQTWRGAKFVAAVLTGLALAACASTPNPDTAGSVGGAASPGSGVLSRTFGGGGLIW